MELTLSDPPTAGYQPGNTVAGILKYSITAQQETILDASLHLDGHAFVHTSKTKYEPYRSKVNLIEESQVPFQGPFTLKRQQLVWPFEFTLPATSPAENASIPLPPSMDHHFREGLQVRVEYNITANIRLGSNHKSVKQASITVLVRHTRDSTLLDGGSYILSFPVLELQTNALPKTLRSRLKDLSGRSKIDTNTPKQILQLDLTVPSTLSPLQRDAVTCCLKDITGACDSTNSTTLILEIVELVLRCRVAWQDILEDVRHVGTVIKRPDIDVRADGQSFGLPDSLGLQDFTHRREMPAPLQSHDSVIPNVSVEYTLTVTAILKHKASSCRLSTKASIPILVIDSAATGVFPPAYERLEETEETVPPSYGDASS